MLKLCGFAVSNYYNKVKLSLLEKGIPFAEETVFPSQDDSLLALSPMGKVPFLRTDAGVVSESQVITEYMEEAYPDPPLYPKEVFARAKTRELIEHLELDLELVARRLYGEAFFGGHASDETKAEVARLLRKGLKSLARILRFSPFAGSAVLTHADCAAWAHLPVISNCTKKIYGEDLVAEALPDAKEYLKMMAERPAVQKVWADYKAGLATYMSGAKKQ